MLMGGQIHPAFGEKYKKLIIQVEELKERNPEGYQQHPATKFLNNINEFIFRRISEDPSAPEFRQGKTLGTDKKHWFRAKFIEDSAYSFVIVVRKKLLFILG
jgi:toxin YhaV